LLEVYKLRRNMLKISNSSINIYRSCPKKYHWKYIEGLTPYKKSTALTLGSIVHTAFDMYYNNFSEHDVSEYIVKTADEEIAKADPQVAEDLLVAKYTALGMWMHYPKDLSVFSEIRPELSLEIKFDRGVKLVLRVDGLVKVDGKMWVRELKTTGLSFSQFEKRCETAPQCSTYTLAVRKAGIPVEGVIYDFVKKPLLRRHIKESKEQFGKRILLDYKTRPNFYYKRHYSYRSQENLDLFEEDLKLTVKAIKSKRIGWPRNPDACWNFNSACPYMPICFQKDPDNLTIDLFFVKGASHGGKSKSGKSKTRC